MVHKRKLKPTELIKWKPNLEEIVSRNIKAYMDILSVDADGKVKTSKGFELDAYMKILSQNIEIYNISSPEIKRRLLFKAGFTRLKKYKNQNIHTFRRALSAEVQKYLSLPVKQYWIFFPLHVVHDQLKNFRSFKILGKKLFFRNWEYVQKHFMLDKFIENTQFRLQKSNVSLGSDFTPVMILSEGRDLNEVFDGAQRIFDLFRCLLNLLSQFGAYHRQFGWPPKPLAKILPPPVYGVFNLDGTFVNYYQDMATYPEYGKNYLSLNKISAGRKLANILKTPKSNDDTVQLIIVALEKYGRALDTTEWPLAFLELWQILELLALQTSEQFNMKNVKNRVDILLQKSQFAKDLLQALYETRNALVHEGHFPHRQGVEEIGLLKYIVEVSINGMFKQLKNFRTRGSLAKFYDYSPVNNLDLAESHRVISVIQKQRTIN